MNKKFKIILFNPKSAEHKHRIPNSILQVGAALEGKFEYKFVDGNREDDPYSKITDLIVNSDFNVFASTVMPGPQLKQAIPFTKKIRKEFPDLLNIWGGYFPANHYEVVLNSGYVDYIIAGPGDNAFPNLLFSIEKGEPLDEIKNLIYKENDKIIKTSKEALLDQDTLPKLPYDKLHKTYNMNAYLGKTFLGNKTIAYHSSIGCPFTCSFCAVVPIYEAKWKGKSASKIYQDIKYLKNKFGGDAIEFHDNNFFVSEKRTVEFARLIKPEKMNWWGEARIDTVNKYSDDSLEMMRDAGCRMVFFGAESGNDTVLKQMNKGGTQNANQIKEFAARLAQFDIIPEYSFVLGTPANSAEKVNQQIEQDIAFIKEIKSINPKTEIIIYVYSPIPLEGSELYNDVKKSGFKYPDKLEDWLNPFWENFDGRKNPLTPWLTPKMIKKIQDFETVLNARYPTASDIKLTHLQKRVISLLSGWRYTLNFFAYPYELRFLFSKWLHYRQPEMEGF